VESEILKCRLYVAQGRNGTASGKYEVSKHDHAENETYIFIAQGKGNPLKLKQQWPRAVENQ